MSKGRQNKDESHLRYKAAVNAVIASAPTKQIKDLLRPMIVPEFLEPRDEGDTVSVSVQNCFFIVNV